MKSPNSLMIKVWCIDNLQEENISKMSVPIRIVLLMIWLHLHATAQCDYSVDVFAYNGTTCVNETLGVITDANSPTYQWFRNDTLIPGETNEYLIINALGAFRVEVTDLMDCTESSGAFAITLSPPQVSIIGDTVFCEGSSAQLVAVPDSGSSVQYWYDENSYIFGEFQDTVIVNAPGFFYVVTMDINSGCYGLDTTFVTEVPNTLGVPLIYQSTDTLFTDTAAYYQWYFDLNPIPGANNNYHIITGNGIYQVEIADTSGCMQISNGFIVGENIFTFPEDIVFQDCSDPFNPGFTGEPTHQNGMGAFGFKDSYNNAGSPIYTDAAFKYSGFNTGNWLPDFSAPDQNNTIVHTSYDPSKPTILDLCAVWCGPCQNHASGLNTWLETLELQGTPVNYIIILFQDGNGLSTDQVDAQEWATVFELSVPVLWGDSTQGFYNNFNVSAIPTFVTLGVDQEIIGVQEGVDNPSLETLIQNYYNDHPLCNGIFDEIERSFQWSSQGSMITLNQTQNLNFASSCTDGILNGNEINTDCGGPDCPPCVDNDGDGVVDSEDNCPGVPNPVQSDQNGNGIGDLCDSLTINIPKVGIGTPIPKDGLHLQDGNLYLQSAGAGVVLTSPDGSCWKLVVAIDGSISGIQIDCPE